MNKPIAIGVGLLVLVLLLLFSTTYTVKFNEVAIKATFGETDESSVITEPGLHFRLPVFVDKIRKLDTRLQLVESPMEEIETADGFAVVVRAFLLWRVDTETPVGPLDFYKAYTSVDGARASLQRTFRPTFTGVLSRYRFDDLIGAESRLAEAEAEIRQSLQGALASAGVQPVAVGISRVMLPPKTSSAVLERMEQTRTGLANDVRNKSQAQAERIRSEGNTWADKIRAFAVQRAEEIRAVGELEAAKYYEEMGQEEDLAIFLVQLDMLKETLANNSTFFIDATKGLTPFSLMTGEGLPVPAASSDGDDSRAEREAPDEEGGS